MMLGDPATTALARPWTAAQAVELGLGVGAIAFGIYRYAVARNPRDRSIDVQVMMMGAASFFVALARKAGSP